MAEGSFLREVEIEGQLLSRVRREAAIQRLDILSHLQRE